MPAASLALTLDGLPGLPAGAASSRATSAAAEHVFAESDQHSSSGASWAGTTLSLATADLSYSVVGFNVGDGNPLSVAIDGTMNGLWLGVSDYGRGTWLWLGGEHDEGATETLPPGGDYVNDAGAIYFALICPDGAQAAVTTTFAYDAPDIDPPVWQGGEGIISVDRTYSNPQLSWHTAIDAESPPVTYLIYYTLNAVEINWDTPQLTVPADHASTSFSIADFTANYDFAVRARDALGNTTANMNSLSADGQNRYGTRIVDWLPGDKIELAWGDPEADARLLLIGPGFLEGWPEYTSMMDGIVTFSEGSATSGVAEEWAVLQSAAPTGGYLLELWMDLRDIDHAETLVVKLFDSEGALKQDCGSLTIAPGGGVALDYTYFRHGPGTWPQQGAWNAGDRFELAWDDAALDIDLVVEDPGYKWRSPKNPEDPPMKMEYSEENIASGNNYEWIKLTENSDPGLYEFIVQWWTTAGDLPDTLDVTWTLYDSANQPVMGPGVVTLTNDPEDEILASIGPLAWLAK